MMLFVLGQSSDRKAILRNLHEKHHPFPARRPLGAKEVHRKIYPLNSFPGFLCEISPINFA